MHELPDWRKSHEKSFKHIELRKTKGHREKLLSDFKQTLERNGIFFLSCSRGLESGAESKSLKILKCLCFSPALRHAKVDGRGKNFGPNDNYIT